MEKPFSITFDFSNMQVLIPSGRLMNLKEQLHWDDIDCSGEELSQLTHYVSAHDFHVNMDFSKKSESYVNSIINGKYHAETRKFSYADRGINHVINPKNFAKVTEKLTEELRSELAELFEETKENEQVSKKMQKLAQLKLMNSTK